MKTLLTLFLALSIMPLFGQTKSDFVTCLDLIFNHPEFEPAQTNSYDIHDGFVIIAANRTYNRNSLTPVNQILQELTQDDFYTNHKVMIVRKEDLEPMGIAEDVLLTLLASGTESSLFIRVATTIKAQRLAYNWDYKLDKINDEWEISAASLSTQKQFIQR